MISFCMVLALLFDQVELLIQVHKHYIHRKLTSPHTVLLLLRRCVAVSKNPALTPWYRVGGGYIVWRGRERIKEKPLFSKVMNSMFWEKMDVNEFIIPRNVNYWIEFPIAPLPYIQKSAQSFCSVGTGEVHQDIVLLKSAPFANWVPEYVQLIFVTPCQITWLSKPPPQSRWVKYWWRGIPLPINTPQVLKSRRFSKKNSVPGETPPPSKECISLIGSQNIALTVLDSCYILETRAPRA